MLEKQSQQMYDIFMAVADEEDGQGVQRIVDALRAQDLNVFVDNGATDEDVRAGVLDQSRLMVPYYSRRFSEQPHCQSTLMQAFLAGHRSGDSLQHIAVINPDDPAAAHITPIEVADARYVVPRSGPSAIAQAIKAKISLVPGLIGDAPVPAPLRWIGIYPPATQSAQRYAELWQIHSELEIGNYELISDAPAPGRLVAILGDSHTGKTDLAATYAQLFGAQYQGGVYWTSLRDCEPTQAAIGAQYTEELCRIGDRVGLSSTALSKQQLLGHMASYLSEQQEPSLWIIDNVPRNVSGVIDELIPPEKRLHTICISRHNDLRDFMSYIALGHRSSETYEQ